MDAVESIDTLSFPDVTEYCCDACVEVSLADKVAKVAFKVASYLTDPVCKGHELFRRLYVVEALNPTAHAVANKARKVFLYIGIVACGAVAVFSSVPGIVLRYAAAQLQSHPYIHVKGHGHGKALPADHAFTLLSWNICCISGGYSISDGGVAPWASRIDAIIDEIIAKDADVNCLYEVFDVKAATYISERLKEHGYVHIYFNIGPKAVGVNSGILVASKYDVQNPEFTAYSEDMLVGRTKNAAKGVFAFDLSSEGKSFARIFATHLQHSEEPEFATDEEVEARRKQMKVIADKIDQVRDKCVVLTGDLNFDDSEFDAIPGRDRFQEGNTFTEKTWGGDEFCAGIVEKRVSQGLNLDHTAILRGTARDITTSLVRTGYDPAVYTESALSDHEGLFSKISL
ncbi:MAG: hypothetical protein Q8K75_08375 [Chlamydiales bacterium]|nr:hypothetical protein [Chlamydiales bacterium]